MSATVAAIGGIVLSICTILGCMIFIPVIYREINSINDELVMEVEEFNVLADDAWKKIIIVKKSAANAIPKQRHAREGYGMGSCCKDFDTFNTVFKQNMKGRILGCNANNGCPAGPKGAPGESGQDGLPGENGYAGAKGLDGNYPPIALSQDGKCYPCPFGPRGPAGQVGAPGPAGSRGMKGKCGSPGPDGKVGAPGDPGPAGPNGKPGGPGPKGDPGKNGEKCTKGPPGDKGPKGETGPVGPPGPAGPKGKSIDTPGAQGPQGPAGKDGQPGPKGPAGPAGKNGLPGKDAAYCPCPKRIFAKKNRKAALHLQ